MPVLRYRWTPWRQHRFKLTAILRQSRETVTKYALPMVLVAMSSGRPIDRHLYTYMRRGKQRISIEVRKILYQADSGIEWVLTSEEYRV